MNLTRNQTRAIKALMEYPTIDQVAEAIGVNPRTVFRWLDDPGFKVELSQAEGRSLDKIARRLLMLGNKAIDAIEDIIDDPDQPGATNKRLSAQAILDQVVKLRELRNIEARLADLEKAVF